MLLGLIWIQTNKNNNLAQKHKMFLMYMIMVKFTYNLRRTTDYFLVNNFFK